MDHNELDDRPDWVKGAQSWVNTSWIPDNLAGIDSEAGEHCDDTVNVWRIVFERIDRAVPPAEAVSVVAERFMVANDAGSALTFAIGAVILLAELGVDVGELYTRFERLSDVWSVEVDRRHVMLVNVVASVCGLTPVDNGQIEPVVNYEVLLEDGLVVAAQVLLCAAILELADALHSTALHAFERTLETVEWTEDERNEAWGIILAACALFDAGEVDWARSVLNGLGAEQLAPLIVDSLLFTLRELCQQGHPLPDPQIAAPYACGIVDVLKAVAGAKTDTQLSNDAFVLSVKHSMGCATESAFIVIVIMFQSAAQEGARLLDFVQAKSGPGNHTRSDMPA